MWELNQKGVGETVVSPWRIIETEGFQNAANEVGE